MGIKTDVKSAIIKYLIDNVYFPYRFCKFPALGVPYFSGESPAVPHTKWMPAIVVHLDAIQTV